MDDATFSAAGQSTTPGEARREPALPATLDVNAVRQGIAGLRLGNPLIYLPAIGSTNTYLMARAREGAAEGTAVTTDDQTAGRGRMGRVWKALPGQQLILSLLLRPVAPAQFVMMASSVAMAEAIERVAGLPTTLKWPNDVLVHGRKVCGILIETGEGAAVVGMGLNVNGSLADDPELAARATTLADERGGATVSREALAIATLTRLDAHYDTLQTGGLAGRQAVRDAWRTRLATLGQRVVIRQSVGSPTSANGETTITGLAEAVDADGALTLLTDDGQRRTITWGDVE